MSQEPVRSPAGFPGAECSPAPPGSRGVVHSRWLRRGVAALSLVTLAACGSGRSADEPDVTTTVADQPADTAAPLRQSFADASQLHGEFDADSLVGRDAVLWFWAPWCTTCRAEGPEVAEVAARFADEVPVIGVAGLGEIGPMHDFIADTGTGEMVHVNDVDGAVWSAFGVYTQPAFAFIDDDGSVAVFVGTMGGDDVAARIDELLAT